MPLPSLAQQPHSRHSASTPANAAPHKADPRSISRADSGGDLPSWEASADTELGASRAVSRLPSHELRDSTEQAHRLSNQLPSEPDPGRSDVERSAAAVDGSAGPGIAGAADADVSEAIDLSALDAPGFVRLPEHAEGRRQQQMQGRSTTDAVGSRSSWLQGLPDSKGIFARVQQLRLARRTQA